MIRIFGFSVAYSMYMNTGTIQSLRKKNTRLVVMMINNFEVSLNAKYV